MTYMNTHHTDPTLRLVGRTHTNRPDPRHPAIAGAIPVTEGPRVTFDLAALGQAVTATVSVDADRIGFHVEPGSDDGVRARRDFVSIAPVQPFGAVVLLELGEAHGPAVLDTIQAGIRDGWAGEFQFDVCTWALDAGAGWFVMRARYVDAEGVTH